MTKHKVITNRINEFFTNNKITVGVTAPTTGTHVAGDIVISTSSNATAFGWICTVSGTPGTWKVLKSGSDVTSIEWSGVTGKPATYAPTIGTTSTTAFRGDYGNIAYNHSQQTHAPSNAQKNSDITKAELESKLTGAITTHTHNYLPLSGGTVTGGVTINGNIATSSNIIMSNNRAICSKDKDGNVINMMTYNSVNNLHLGYTLYANEYTSGRTYLGGATSIHLRTVSGNILLQPSKTTVATITNSSQKGIIIGSKTSTANRYFDINRKCETNTTSGYTGSTARIVCLNSEGGCTGIEYRENSTTLNDFRIYNGYMKTSGKRIFISTSTPPNTYLSTGDVWFDI